MRIMNARKLFRLSVLAPASLGLMLVACGGGGGGSDAGGGDSNGSGDDPIVYDPPPELSDVAGATSLLFYTVGERDSGRLRLVAVDADNPERQAEVESAIVENFAASGETAGNKPSPYHADARNLPLGVHAGEIGTDGMRGTVTNINHPYVVYNKPDGHLYRVATYNGDLEPVRISTESEAQIVCGATIVPDYTDPLDALLVYQIPAEGQDCMTSVWRMTSIGAGSGDYASDLFDAPVVGGANIIPIQDWDTGVASGFLALTGDGVMTRFFADDRAPVTVENGIDTANFQVLERSDPDGRILMSVGSSHKPVVYLPKENRLEDVGGEIFFGPGTTASNTARIRGGLVIADVDNDLPGPGTRQLLRYDPDKNELTVEYSGWGTGVVEAGVNETDTRAVRIVGVHESWVAWAFRAADPSDADPSDADQLVAQLESYNLETGTSLTLATVTPRQFDMLSDNQLSEYFPVSTEVADQGWVLYSDFVEEETVAVDIASGNKSALGPWPILGQTWSTSIEPSGRTAMHVLFADGSRGVFRSRAVGNPFAGSEQVFDSSALQIIDHTGLSGFGNKALMGIKRIGGYHDVMFIDITDGNSLRLLSDGDYAIARPVAFY